MMRKSETDLPKRSCAFREAYTSAIPMKRYGARDEIAAAVSFLASENAA
jgi:NAD(P)-dependent dehydrogenase (short-subunit alcohol dehydrogenase family)